MPSASSGTTASSGPALPGAVAAGFLLGILQSFASMTQVKSIVPGIDQIIIVIATDADISKAQASRLATVGHDGLARSINPVHTMSDGDTLFALGTGRAGKSLGMMVLGTMAAEAVALAVVRAIRAAQGITVGKQRYPAAGDLA